MQPQARLNHQNDRRGDRYQDASFTQVRFHVRTSSSIVRHASQGRQ
jgi:hypothetical protein